MTDAAEVRSTSYESLSTGGSLWLAGPGRDAVDAEALLKEFSSALIDLGLPLARATTHAPTLHPAYRWVMRVWRRGRPTVELRRGHGVEGTAVFHGNPVEHVVASGAPFLCRLDGDDPLPFPMLEELRREGLTHYLIVPLRASGGRTGAASWATDQPGGFAPEAVTAVTTLADPFSLVFELKGLDRMLIDVLKAYVGDDPARRILAGTVRRGDLRPMRAAMMLTDLRGFGELSDRLPPDAVVASLNRMFDALVPAVEAEGGEVLKYTGDGILAVFDEGSDEAGARGAAFRAAEAGLASLALLQRDGRPEFDVGVALHVGDVAYGNIGGGDRLDFTAIGRDLNLLSRVERLCKTFRLPLLATGEFVEGLGLPVDLIDTVALRGFAERHAIYGRSADASRGFAEFVP